MLQGNGALEARVRAKDEGTHMPTARSGQQPDFSIIVPCYDEEETILEFDARLHAALAKLPYDFELVYVNDGSRDATLAILNKLVREAPRDATLIDLAANVGQNCAQSAGIQHALGRDLVFMDCDLQTGPEALGALIERFRDGCDMASGMRVHRRDPAIRRLLSSLGNRILSRVLNIQIRDLGSGLKIIRGDLLRSFGICPERPMNPGAIIQCLRDVAEVPVEHRSRRHGKTRWTLRRALILYHNVLLNLTPIFYPLAAGATLVAFTGFLLLLTVAGVYPAIFPWARSPLLPAFLVTIQIILSMGFLLALGEFVLRSRSSANAPAYVVRSVLRRAEPDPAIDAALPTACLDSREAG